MKNYIFVISISIILYGCTNKEITNTNEIKWYPNIILVDSNGKHFEAYPCDPAVVSLNKRYNFDVLLSDSTFYEVDLDTKCEKNHISIKPLIEINGDKIEVDQYIGKASILFDQEYVNGHRIDSSKEGVDIIYAQVLIKFPTPHSGDCAISQRIFFKVE